MSTAIRIAITGGGLAGASLLHALLPYKHLDVHIFESAPAFKEAGMAVGVTRNALAALDLIGPSAAAALERAGAVPQKGFRIALGQGPSQGSIIGEMDVKAGKRIVSIVHRADFLRELLADVSRDQMHANKKLESIDKHSSTGPITLHFTDGTTHECDILVGADGIHSTVRKLILGAEDPAASARNSGWWAIMVLKPYEEAKSAIAGPSLDIEDAREHGFVGDGAYLMWNLLSHGQLLQFVVTGFDEHVESEWTRTVTADEIKRLYQHWPEHLRDAVIELLCKQDQQPAFYLWEHPNARTYKDGPVCVMGDAAHAMTPWQASGGGMSIEDSLVLSTLLGRSMSPSEAITALKVYDHVRRPRTQRVVESCRKTGLMMSGVCEETKLDLEKLSQKLLPRWDFIMNLDVEQHRDEAVRMMDEELGKES